MEMVIRNFESQILYFNGMYKLPVAQYPTTFNVIEDESKRRPINPIDENPVRGKAYIVQRMEGFIQTLYKEMTEGEEIMQKVVSGKHMVEDQLVAYEEIDFLTDMADWLGDLIVYEASEMAKYGIPQYDTLGKIMQSNFSKLQEDGSVRYNAQGKVEKGPHYWKPEPIIKQMLKEMRESVEGTAKSKEINEDEKPG